MMEDHTREPLEQRAYERIMLELTNRTAMMVVHGTLLLLVGLTMSITGAPAPLEGAFGPWARILLGGSAMLIGWVILFGAAETDNDMAGWRALVVGFVGALMWHVALAVTYAVAAWQAPMALLLPGETLGAAITNRGYIPLIYVGYVMLTGIHLRTVWKLGPPPR